MQTARISVDPRMIFFSVAKMPAIINGAKENTVHIERFSFALSSKDSVDRAKSIVVSSLCRNLSSKQNSVLFTL